MDLQETSQPARRANHKYAKTVLGVLLAAAVCGGILWSALEVPDDVPTNPMASLSLALTNTFSTGKPNYQRQGLIKLSKQFTVEKEVEGWERSRSRETIDYINPLADTTIISGKEICQNPNTTLVIICMTRSSDFSKRRTIRETWGSHNLSNVKVGFLIGLAQGSTAQESIKNESSKYRDIIQENMVDTYWNLSIKSVAMLKWYVRWCPMYTLLLKADDDTFIDVKTLDKLLPFYRPYDKIVGRVNKNYPAPRYGFYYIPKYIYSEDVLPDYLGGPAYFMSRSVALKLYAAALETPIFHLEDVYITGICARKANVSLANFPWASFWIKTRETVFNKKCCCLRHHVFCHPVREQGGKKREMSYLWRRSERMPVIIHSQPQPIKMKNLKAVTNDTQFHNSSSNQS